MESKRLRIFVDAHSFDKEFQGARTFIAGIYNCLLARTDVDIYFGAENKENVLRAMPAANPDNILKYNSGGSFSRFAFDIPRLIKNYNIDVAHFQYLAPFGHKRCMYIVTTHDILFKDFKQEFSFGYRLTRDVLFRRAIKMADIKTTVSSYSAQQIEKHYHIPQKQLHILSNGVSPNFTSAINKEEAINYIKQKFGIENYILCVSRVEPRKNQGLLVKIFIEKKLFENGLSLVLIGKYSIKDPNLEAQLSRLSADEKKFIHWIEQVEDYDLKAFYKACVFFSYPSKAEGFGIPPLEAALSGVRVLCSDQTAMSDFTFFKPYFANPEDTHLWATFMIELSSKNLLDEDHLFSISEKIVATYNWQHTADKLYNLIRTNKAG